MPSCWATRRASSPPATAQHPQPEGPPHSLSVAPTTSWPASTKSAAATDESTPPDMATSTRMALVSQLDGQAQTAEHARNDPEGVVDLLARRRRTERKAHRRAGRRRRIAQG